MRAASTSTTTTSIPAATSLPGAELVLRVRELAPTCRRGVIVNCAGRTRSIIGTQSLINAGLPNPVQALRNGTIGWTGAGQTLDHGASRRARWRWTPPTASRPAAAPGQLPTRPACNGLPTNAVATLAQPGRTLYRFDVRTPEEYADGHLPGFASAPGGQLAQETDHSAPVRGAWIVLADDDNGVRADMTAPWPAQMGWEVFVVEPEGEAARSERGTPAAPVPEADAVESVAPAELVKWLDAAGEGRSPCST